MWRDRTGLPFPVEPWVKNLDEFRQRIEPMLHPDSPTRISGPAHPLRNDIEKVVKGFQRRFFATANVNGPYEHARHICGGAPWDIEDNEGRPLLGAQDVRGPRTVSFPHWARILGGRSQWGLGLRRHWVLGWSLLLPQAVPTIPPPALKMMTAPFGKEGLPVMLHTEGNVEILISQIIRSGYNLLEPLEVKADIGVVRL